MEEVCYLDTARLVAYELPPGWDIVLDERMGIRGPQPSGAALFFRHERLPVQATNERGEVVTAHILSCMPLSSPRLAFRVEPPLPSVSRHTITPCGAPLLMSVFWTACIQTLG